MQLVFNISELEAGYRKFDDMRAAWRDKVAALEADKVILVDQLQQTVDREGRLEGEVSRLTEEVSRLKGALVSSESELQSQDVSEAHRARGRQFYLPPCPSYTTTGISRCTQWSRNNAAGSQHKTKMLQVG